MHLYGIDCGNGALLPLAELPHCGAVVSRAQTERATRLLRRLAAELSRRQELLAAAGFGDIREQRAAAVEAERLPHIFVLLDRWEGFTATLGELEAGGLTEILTRLLTEGASVGLHLVMTGDRSLLLGRISSLCEEKLIFKLAEKDDYRLAGLNPRDLPDDVPPGRAFRAGSGTELQVALLAPGRIRSRPGRGAAGHRGPLPPPGRGGAGGTAAVPGGRAAVAPVIRRARGSCGRSPPGRCGAWSGWAATRWQRSGPISPPGCPASSWPVRPSRGGPPSCCRWRRSFLAAGTPVVLAAPRPSPLRALAGVPGVLGVFDQPELGEAELAGALASFVGPGVVLIDDAELLRDCGAAGELSRLIALGRRCRARPGARRRRREHRPGVQRLAGRGQAGQARLPDRAVHHPRGRPDRGAARTRRARAAAAPRPLPPAHR